MTFETEKESVLSQVLQQRIAAINLCILGCKEDDELLPYFRGKVEGLIEAHDLLCNRAGL